MAAGLARKVAQFWREPLYNKAHHLGNLYYKAKSAAWYRVVFAEFGSGSFIRKPMLILYPGCIRIGCNVAIRDGVRLEVVKMTASRTPSLIIGHNTNIEQNVHIVCHSRIQIGENVSITGHCAIVDVTHSFEDITDPTKVGSRIKDDNSFVEIGEGAFIGWGSVILPNVRVGRHAVIGANSVVASDVPDFTVAAGVPATVLKQYDARADRWVKTCS